MEGQHDEAEPGIAGSGWSCPGDAALLLRFSAQIKTVIDRFYATSYSFTGGKKAALLATAWDANDWTMEALTAHYHTLTRYMRWQDAGTVLAIGCGTRSDIEQSQFPAQAYQLGTNF